MHTCSAVALTAPRWSLSTCLGPAQGESLRSEVRLSRLRSHATGAAGLSVREPREGLEPFGFPISRSRDSHSPNGLRDLPVPSSWTRSTGRRRGRGCRRLGVRGAARTRHARGPRPEPFFSPRGWQAEAGTFLPAPPVGGRSPEPFFSRRLLAGGGVQRRNGPPAAGFVQRSPAADVGRPGTGCRCGALWR